MVSVTDKYRKLPDVRIAPPDRNRAGAIWCGIGEPPGWLGEGRMFHVKPFDIDPAAEPREKYYRYGEQLSTAGLDPRS